MYTNICGSFPTTSWNGQRYFITFTNDYSRHWYVNLIYEKSQSLDVFKIYKVKVENQLNRKIKVIRSDCDSDYYGRYNRSGRCPGLFASFLKKCDIVHQYTMQWTSRQNCVTEGRNTY